MITKQEYLHMLEGNRSLIEMQIKDISDEQSLLQPTSGGNCLRWVLGHLADNLAQIVILLGEEPTREAKALKRFARGSEPVKGDEPGLPGLEEIMTTYHTLEKQVFDNISKLDESDFFKENTSGNWKGSLGWKLYFFAFHHHYHIGQLEFLRNLAGFTESLI